MSLGCFECRLYEKSNSFSSPLSLSLSRFPHHHHGKDGKTPRACQPTSHSENKHSQIFFCSFQSMFTFTLSLPMSDFHAHLHFLSIVIFYLFIIFTTNLCTTNASLFVFILLLCLPKVLLKCRLAALTIYTLQMNKII